MRKIRTTPAANKQNVGAPPSQHPPERRATDPILSDLRHVKSSSWTKMRSLVAADKEISRQQIEERSRTSVVALELGERGWVRLFVEERVAGPTSYHPEHGGEYRIGLSVEDIATGEDLDLTDEEVQTLEAALDD